MATPDYGPWGLPVLTTAGMNSIVILSDPALAVTPASGAAGPTGGTGAMSLTNLATLVGGGAIAIGDLPTITVAKGGTNLTSLPTANQVLGANNGATAYEGKTITAGSNVTVTHGTGTITIASTGGSGSPAGSSGQLQYNNASAFAGAADLAVGSSGELLFTPIADPASPADGATWFDTTKRSLSFMKMGVVARTGGVIYRQTFPGSTVGTSSTAAASIFAGGLSDGTLTFPANKVVAGNAIMPYLWGSYGCAASAVLTIDVYFGAVKIGTGSITLANAVTGNAWTIEPVGGMGGCYFVYSSTSGGGTGLRGLSAFRVNFAGNSAATINLTGSTTAVAGSIVVDPTVSNLFDIKVTFAGSSSSNAVQLTGGWIEGRG